MARTARWGITVWTLIGVLILGYFAFRYVLYPVRIIFPILIVATVVVYLLDPLVTRLERRGIGRGWGTALLYLVFFGILGVAIAFLVPIVSEQVRSFIQTVPDLATRAVEGFRDFLERLGLNAQLSDVVSGFQEGGSAAGSFVGRVTSFAGGVVHVALVFLLGPIVAFYLVVDLPKIRSGLRAAVPAGKREEWRPVYGQISDAVGGFFRGQLLIAAFVALASMLVLWAIGLPYWAVVGIVAGIFNLVPMIGPYIGGVVAVFIALTVGRTDHDLLPWIRPGMGLAVASVIALIVVQQVDNHIVSPNVVARTVKLHPVTVMLSLLAFGTLFGLWGLLLAVPVVATVKILAVHYWDTRVTWPPEGSTLEDPQEPPPSSGSPSPEAAAAKGRVRRIREGMAARRRKQGRNEKG
ncbi:MAG: AI-2E family transporter [Actinomycetota bacterium]